MVELDQIKFTLGTYKEPLKELKGSLDLENKALRIEEIEGIMEEPGFWDDTEKSQNSMKDLKNLKDTADEYKGLEQSFEDIETLLEMGYEAEDPELVPEIQKELDDFTAKFDELRLSTLLCDEYDSANAILSLHAGAGGTEAMDWCSMLYRMYKRWCEVHGFTTEELEYVDGEEAGIQSVSMKITGENAYGFLRSEVGVHRLVRISPFDSAGRRHTSFASCEVIPELDKATEDDIKIDMSDIRVDTYRATGKGGQHINKTDTAVRMTHNPTGIVVSCQAERSQLQNKETCLKMLKAKLFALAQAAEMEKIEDLKGNQMEIAWGSQIRSYVFCPYTLVKDNRTGYEEVDVDAVMDGKVDGFIFAYLSGMKNEK